MVLALRISPMYQLLSSRILYAEGFEKLKFSPSLTVVFCSASEVDRHVSSFHSQLNEIHTI